MSDPRAVPLLESAVAANPIAQFANWFHAAEEARVPLPEAMTLATATKDGVPSGRTLLLKGFDERGFVFFTNYESRKGRELDENPRAALVFYWNELGRQVRIEGTVTRLAAEESEAYFRTRPLASRLSAWASRQSEVIANRDALESRLDGVRAEYGGEGDVPLPTFWGGYRVSPESVEFWQHRPDRLHDRLRYRLRGDGGWALERLSP